MTELPRWCRFMVRGNQVERDPYSDEIPGRMGIAMSWRRQLAVWLWPEFSRIAQEKYAVWLALEKARSDISDMKRRRDDQISALSTQLHEASQSAQDAKALRAEAEAAKARMRQKFDALGLKDLWGDEYEITDVGRFLGALDDKSLEKLRRGLKKP